MSYYISGTVTLTQGSEEIIGQGTDFDSTTISGSVLYFRVTGPGNPSYTIYSINDSTSVTLTAPYGGETVRGARYMILYDTTSNLKAPIIKEWFDNKEDIARKAMIILANAINEVY